MTGLAKAGKPVPSPAFSPPAPLAQLSLTDLAIGIRAEHEAAKAPATPSSMRFAPGHYLLEAKRRVGHGNWTDWLQDCNFPERTAQIYIQVARHERQLKAQPTADLTIADALKTVAKQTQIIRKELPPPGSVSPTILLKTHLGADVPYRLPKGKATFNRTNEQVDWAPWTWNPITGCLRDCPFGCYARELSNLASFKPAYPVGFTPLFHHERLDAPANTPVPDSASLSATEQPEGHYREFAPPFEWVARLSAQAREAGCKIWQKSNLLGRIDPQHPGMKLIQELPDLPPLAAALDLLVEHGAAP